jgi:hypothetical protein
MASDHALFTEHVTSEKVGSRKGIQLLKVLEEVSADIFASHDTFASERNALGEDSESRERVVRAALRQDFRGTQDYSQSWFSLLAACTARQRLQRAFVRAALTGLDHGLSPFDRSLLYHATLVSDAYDDWFVSWARAVQVGVHAWVHGCMGAWVHGCMHAHAHVSVWIVPTSRLAALHSWHSCKL